MQSCVLLLPEKNTCPLGIGKAWLKASWSSTPTGLGESYNRAQDTFRSPVNRMARACRAPAPKS